MNEENNYINSANLFFMPAGSKEWKPISKVVIPMSELLLFVCDNF